MPEQDIVDWRNDWRDNRRDNRRNNCRGSGSVPIIEFAPPLERRIQAMKPTAPHTGNAGHSGSSTEMVEALYHELKQLARARIAIHPVTLQPTQLVHEAWLKLGNRGWQWENRAHFVSAAAEAMRRIIIDHARRRDAARRGGGWQRITLTGQATPEADCDVDLVALDQALTELEQLDARMAELVKLRYFVGLSKRECAGVLEISERTVTRWWDDARTWLHHRLNADESDPR